MKVLILNKPMVIGVVPRTAPYIGDNLILKAKNEFSELVITLDKTFWRNKDRFYFSLKTRPADLKAGNTYEIEIFNDSIKKVIYKGKLLIVSETQNIQNYEPLNQRFKTKV